MAVGGGVAERWTGREWSVLNTSSLVGQSLVKVSCTSIDACTVLARREKVQAARVDIVDRWNGKSWTIQQSWSVQENPSVTELDLAGVSCSSRISCVVVGNDLPAGRPLVERWDGRAWTVEVTPTVPRAQLFDVSCASPRACTAVGDVVGPGPVAGTYLSRQFAERWNGRTWRVERLPLPLRADQRLSAVSCTAPRVCTAIGYGRDGALVERSSVRGWRIQNAAPGREALSDVSCGSANSCTAIGFQRSSGEAPPQFVASWNGSRWTEEKDAERLSGVYGVSCTRRQCIIIGNRTAARRLL
jgi:hypothetical protein